MNRFDKAIAIWRDVPDKKQGIEAVCGDMRYHTKDKIVDCIETILTDVVRRYDACARQIRALKRQNKKARRK